MERYTGFIDIDGTRLSYESAGAGPPLVLLHGFSLDRRMWDDQVEALASHYQVIRYDLRGYGQSPPSTGPYAHVDDLRGLLEHLGITRAAILGLSMGGGIAIDFVLAYPEATQALIVASPTLGGYRWAAELDQSLGAIYETARRAGVEAARKQWLAHPLFAPARERPTVAARLAQLVNDYSGWHWVNPDPGRQLSPPAVDRVEEIAAPTVVLVGGREVPGFRVLADLLAKRVRSARQVVLPNAGHMGNMEDAAQFNRTVLSALTV
jgi:3-oxoadipate enol-lactonase